jgi:hypothetical protein
LSGAGDGKIGAVIDIPKGMSPNDDGLGPIFDESGYVINNNRLSKDGAIKIVPDGAIG